MIYSAPISSRTEDPQTGWRWYEHNGQKHISVTQVLGFFPDPGLTKWYIKSTPEQIEQRKLETASQGTEIHTQAHQGKEDRLNGLLETIGAKTIASEVVVVSKNGWAGQADRIIEINGKKYVIDLKSGKFGNVAYQLAAYSLAANEVGFGLEGMGVISLPRDLTKEAKWFDYSAHMEMNQYRWCCLFDAWKGLPFVYKHILDWPFFNVKTALNYNWSFGDNHEHA